MPKFPHIFLDGTPSSEFLFAGLGTVLQGYVSGLAYANLGNLYAGFMSGNSGHLAQQLVEANLIGAGVALSVILAFVFGVSVGTVFLDNVPLRWSVTSVLMLAAAMAAISVSLEMDGTTFPSALALVLLLGIHSVLHRKIDGVEFGRGYVTGYLFALGEALARPQRRSPVLFNIAAWLLLVLGVLLGSAATQLLGQARGAFFVVAALIVLETMLWRRMVTAR